MRDKTYLLVLLLGCSSAVLNCINVVLLNFAAASCSALQSTSLYARRTKKRDQVLNTI